VQSWQDALIGPCYRAVLLGRDPLATDAGRGYYGRWHNPRVTGAWYFADDLPTSLAELAHHLDDGTHRVEVLEAEILFPALLVIDRGRWPATPLSPAIRRFINSVLREHWFAYFRGALFGEAAFGLGTSGLIAPSMRGAGDSICVFTAARPPAEIRSQRSRRGVLVAPFVASSPTHWREVL
jgi:RES domain-containing protein